jgi:hypothetical protein
MRLTQQSAVSPIESDRVTPLLLDLSANWADHSITNHVAIQRSRVPYAPAVASQQYLIGPKTLLNLYISIGDGLPHSIQ